MNPKKTAFVAVAVAWSFLGTASAVAKDDMGGGMDRSDRGEPSGSVVPCSLKGINPAAHPEIFGNPVAVLWFRPIAKWHVVRAARLPTLTE